jgi:hypothetical protein
MIPTLGVLVAVYAVARLLQVPMEMYAPGSARWVIALIISALAITAIVILTFTLVLSGVRSPMPSVPGL